MLDHPAAVRRRPPIDVLVRALGQVAAVERELLDTGHMERFRLRLLLSVPALRAAALHRISEGQRRLAAELQAAYPDRLDAVDAATMIGAITGAVIGAASAALDSDPSDELNGARLEQVIRRALDTAAEGFARF